MDLMITNASELIPDVKIGGSSGCSDHTLLEFTVLMVMGQARSKGKTLNFRKEVLIHQGQGSRTGLSDH